MVRPSKLPKTLRVRPGVDYEFLDQALEALANPLRLRLLDYLRAPHYTEEIASHLGMTRQAARKHLEKLVRVGLLERRPAARESGAVTEYLVNASALFLIHDEIEKLGSTGRPGEGEHMVRTRVDPEDASGPIAPVDSSGPGFAVVRGFGLGAWFGVRRADGTVWTIGRDPQCPVPLVRDPYISNRHAEVRWERDRFWLTDLRSTNGTLFNWAQMPRGATLPLRHGDLVGTGKTLLLFWDAPLAQLPVGARVGPA